MPSSYEHVHAANDAHAGSWAGYRPSAQGSSLYPNEVSSDFAFIPFGGGARKCVGDQFALMEAAVILAMLLRHESRIFRTSASLLGSLGMYVGWAWEAEGGCAMHLHRIRAATESSAPLPALV